jgi:TonB family protein
MKKICILIIFCCYHYSLVHGQDTITTYYNSKSEVAKNQKSAFFYRKLFPTNDLWIANDYYLNGNLKMSGSFKDIKCAKKQGMFKNYFESGKIMSEEQYIDNKKNGKWIQYYENGIKDYESNYKDNIKSGIWIWYFDNGQISAKEKYVNDKRVKAKFWNKEGVKIDSSNAEYAPSFQGGGIDKFSSWVAENVKYPMSFANTGIKGEVKIQFCINPSGEVEGVKIVRSIHSLIDEEAMKVVKSSPKWIPGKLHGKEFKYQYEIPIYFEYKKL